MARRHRMHAATNLAGAVRSATRPGTPSLIQRVLALPRLVRAVRSGRYQGMSSGQLTLMLLGLGYVVSPIDVVPEGLLLVVGLVDDAVILSWLAVSLVRETEDFIAWERAGSPAPGAYAHASGPTAGPASAYATSTTVPSEVVRD